MRCYLALACLGLFASSTRAADPPPDSVADLVRKLDSDDAIYRLRAAHKLGDLGLAAREAVPALAKALRDKSPDVRARAAKSLAAIGAPAVPALIEALKDPAINPNSERAGVVWASRERRGPSSH
jgi:HEAT repeat protein